MAKTNDNITNISPNLLKIFNPYEILEPQKIVIPQVEKLIEIDEPTCSHKILDVNASLLDQKPSYDLIDLFQNMYVTPQHVKAKEENDTHNNITVDDSPNIDYKDFFDIVESGKKIDWSKDNLEEKTIKNNDVEFSIKPKDLIAKLRDDAIDPEDLIDEVIAEKNLERLVNQENIHDNKSIATSTSESNCLDVNEFPKIKMLKPPSNIDLKTASKNTITIHENKVTAAEDKKTLPDENKVDNDITNEFSHLKLNNGSFIDITKDKNILQAFTNKVGGKIINTDFKVITVKNDAKALKKYSITTPESQKNGYTKGANYYEKSVVLPQIMANIIKRQAYLEEKNKKKKRLVLDFGAKADRYIYR